MTTRPLSPGRAFATGAATDGQPFTFPPHHLVTHGVCVGMTGSGKTGLCVALVEETLRARIPALVFDVKGDLANLLLTFPNLAPEEFKPWIDVDSARRRGVSPDAVAAETAQRWREGLAAWGLGAEDVAALREGVSFRVITPGTTAAEPLHVLSSLEAPSALWEVDDEAARDSLSASISLLLRMIDHEADPTRSREHVLLSLLAERRLRAGEGAGLETLVGDLQKPPLARVGALALDDFLSPGDRAALVQDLNTLIASPTFATWRQGAHLDVGAWLAPRDDGRTPAVIVSVAHLDDGERMLVLSLVLEQLLAWVRSLAGTSDLRALVLFDEVFGFLPPHPAAPPTKRPLLALLKQARAFGVGLVLATQNPMDVDYKALSNAGLWFVGRLQTDADRARVVEGLAGTAGVGAPVDTDTLATILKSLPPRTFYVRDVHAPELPPLMETRWTLAWLRGPMTRQELRRLARPAPETRALSLPPTRESPVVDAARESPLSAAKAADAHAPALPEGWRAWYEPAPVTGLPVSAWRYHPWVAATVVAHLRDAKLGVQATRTVRAMAPLTPEGRLDTARGRLFDPTRFLASAPSGAPFGPLPDALFRKGGSAAVERTLREEVYRSLVVPVQTHRDLGLVASPDETPAAFAQRCMTEATRRARIAHDEVTTRHAPRIQKMNDRVGHLQSTLQTIAASSPTGGALATVAAALTGGKRAVRRLETHQDKIATKREKAAADLARAQADLREAVAKRDAELAEVAREAQNVGAGVETRTLAAKKDDIEVTEVGVAWVAGAADGS
jgi:hypothetical protein